MSFKLFLGLLFCLVLIVRAIELFGIQMPSDWVILEPIRRWSLGKGHESDCSLHNAPMHRPWPCSCSRPQGWLRDRVALYLQQRAYDEGLL